MNEYIRTYRYDHDGVQHYFNAANRERADALAVAKGLAKTDFVGRS